MDCGVGSVTDRHKGQGQLLLMLLLLFIVPATVIVAQNATNQTSDAGGMLVAGGLPEDIFLNISNDTAIVHNLSESPIKTNLAESNSTESTVPQENITPPPEIPSSEANITYTNLTVPISEPDLNDTIISQENMTIPEPNVTESPTPPNETMQIPPETNLTVPNATDENITLPEEPPKEPGISVRITSPSRITRGETLTLEAVLENRGGDAHDVILEWMLPEYFEASGGIRQDVGEFPSNSSVVSGITVYSKKNSPLGVSGIKVRISYV